MNGAPSYFQTFADAQEFLGERTGRPATSFARDNPATLEVASELGILHQVEEAAAASRALDETITASSRRAQREVDRAASAKRVEPLPGFTVDALWGAFEPVPYLAKFLLAPGELTVLFGQSGHFKSVAAIDLALSVAAGRAFHGHRTRRAGVLYVAGEGHRGIRKRARAWLLDRGFDASSEQPALYFTTAAADLMGRPDELRATVEHAAAVLGVPIELVVIDTLAACFGAGDENHATDMQLAIGSARQAAPDAATLLVHHVGHGQGDRERGSYALVAAADVRLRMVYDEFAKVVEFGWQKLKDDEKPEALAFTARKVSLDGWITEDGDEETSVVLDLLEGGAAATVPKVTGLGANQEKALKYLRALYAKCRRNVVDDGRDPSEARVLMDGFRRDLEHKGIPRNRFAEVLKGLQDRRLVRVEEPFIYPEDGQ